MPSKLEKEEATVKIINSVKRKNLLGASLVFKGFVNNEWKGNTTKLELECTKHNTILNGTPLLIIILIKSIVLVVQSVDRRE